MAGTGQMQTLAPSGEDPNPSYKQQANGSYTYNGNSGTPSEAVNDPTLAAAIAQWNQQNPLSQTGSAGSAGSNPLQPTYLPTPPTANPTTYSASTYQNNYDPTTATNELNSAAAVQDQGQNSQLMQMLAAQGISPGSSAAQGAMGQLASQQTAALAPSLVSAQQYGAGLNEQSGLANMGAQNTAGQYNAGSSNQMTLQNLQDSLQGQEYNATAANTAGTNSANMANNDWLAQLQAELGLQQTGLSTSGSLAGDQATQAVPMNQSFFSSIMQPIASAATSAAPLFGG